MNLDELVVELALDTKRFTAGQKEALESFRKTDEEMQKRLSNLEAANKNVGYSFNNTTAAAEGLFGALLGAGIAAFARDTMTSVAATGRMAMNIGLMTNELSAFGRMVERNGGDAQTAMGSLKSLNDQVERFKLFGQASDDLQIFAGTIGADLNSSPIAMMMKFAEWADKHRDDLKQVNIIGQLGGLDQGTINTLLKGNVQVIKEYDAAMKDAIGPEQAQAMIRMQNAWTTLEQKIGDVGRDIVVEVEPAFTSASTAVSNFIEHNHRLADVLGEVLTGLAALTALKPAAWLLRLLGLGAAAPVGAAVGVSAFAASKIAPHMMSPETIKSWDEAYPILGKIDSFFGIGGSASAPGTKSPGGAFGNKGEKEAFIRATAIQNGIDPDIAMAVAKSEGFNKFSGDNSTSFGSFQLHVTPGGRGHAVGDQFATSTGLDPSDPANERQGIEYALRYVKAHGWHDFHGAANSGIGDMQGIRTGPISVTIQTASANPREHGRLAAEEIKKGLGSSISTQANTGLSN